MKLYFIRHGESEANIRHVISNRESPFKLTKRGREQVQILAQQLDSMPFTAIYTSPVRRARETADILSQTFQLQVQVTEALREYDCGVLEGKSDAESWRLHRHFYEDWTLRNDYLSKPEGGESFVDIRKRFVPFVEAFEQQSDEHVLMVGHGGLFHLMLPLILINMDHDFVSNHSIGHAECVIAELQADGFKCLQWGALQL